MIEVKCRFKKAWYSGESRRLSKRVLVVRCLQCQLFDARGFSNEKFADDYRVVIMREDGARGVSMRDDKLMRLIMKLDSVC
jgi:hypothetical protein